jgi:alkylation response protein AidB-like acyl-CoA dehydrogenase
MIEAEERALMEETVRGALADALATGADVDAVLAKLGWLEMLADAPGDAIAVVFGALGATNAAATALDDVLASALGREPRPDLAVLLPRFAASDPPGTERGAEGLATARAASADTLLVVGGPAAKPWLGTARREHAELRAVHGVDPAGLQAVRVTRVAVEAELDVAAWQTALALGRRAVAHQILGASRAMLELARAHALERVQFGRPIARFQAVRHRLADALVAVEALEATLGAARDEPNAEVAALAKAAAGRTAETVARHCQQVLAGIGFTTEHAFHRYLKRVLALEGLLGSADAIVLDVGRRLLAGRRVPTLIEL